MDEVSFDGNLSRDRSVYCSPGSLYLAPTSACPCPRESCKERCTESNVLTSDDGKIKRVTQTGYSEMCQREYFVSLKYSKAARRKETFNRYGSHIAEARADQMVAAGLYMKGTEENQSLTCFCCHLNLRILACSYDPMREHARWSPCCQYVIDKNGVDYIHAVLHDTMKLKKEIDEHKCRLGSNFLKEALAEDDNREDTISADSNVSNELDTAELRDELDEHTDLLDNNGIRVALAQDEKKKRYRSS